MSEPVTDDVMVSGEPVTPPAPVVQAAVAVAEPVTEAIDAPEGDEPASDAAASAASKVLTEKKKTYKQRIDEITWQKHEAERRAQALEAQLRERTPAPAATDAPDPNEPHPRQFIDQIGAKFESYEDAMHAYNKAFRKWERDADAQTQQQTAAARSQHEVLTKAQERIDAFKQKQPDFNPGIVASLIPANAVSGPAILDHFYHSELGPELAHALTLDPAELARIASLPYGFAIAALGRLEGKLEQGAAAAPTGSAPAPAYKPANPPIKPVVGSPVTSDDDGDPDDLSEAAVNAYVRRENRKDSERRRR